MQFSGRLLVYHVYFDTVEGSKSHNKVLKIEKLKIPLQGLPVAMVLNREIIYGFWFWNRLSFCLQTSPYYLYAKLSHIV